MPQAYRQKLTSHWHRHSIAQFHLGLLINWNAVDRKPKAVPSVGPLIVCGIGAVFIFSSSAVTFFSSLAIT